MSRYIHKTPHQHAVRAIKKHIIGIALCILTLSVMTTLTYINQTSLAPKIVYAQSIKSTDTSAANKVDLHLAPYSDKHITKNAIDVDEKLSAITFDTRSLLNTGHNQVGSVNYAFLSGNHTSPLAETPEYGTWIWTPLMEMSSKYIDGVLAGAQSNGVNTIYVSIDTYLDVYTMPDGGEKEKQKKSYADKLEYFITHAHERNISIDAEAGWRNWAEDGNTYKAFAILNFIKDFNATHTEKLRGFQYDVEPYMLESYQKNKNNVLKNFLTLIDNTVSALDNSSLLLTVVIPDFYDHSTHLTDPISYNGTVRYTFDHLLNILQQRPDSHIIVMSYRNFADGDDGSIDNAHTEIETATNGMYATHIIVAQETGDVPPPYITFHNTSKNYLNGEIEKINAAFAPYVNFGGIAVHYVNAYLDLK